MDDKRFFDECIEELASIGRLDDGGYTRLGYSETENAMYNWLEHKSLNMGLVCESDSAGNLFICSEKNKNANRYFLIGSHLDSAVDGGQFDGVAGVLVALLTVKKLMTENPELPIKAAAFRCEESARFSQCSIGSGLFAEKLDKKTLLGLRDSSGVSVCEAMDIMGFSPERKPEDPNSRQLLEYLELHIEQGRVLEAASKQIGVVTSIAGNRRYKMNIIGRADHSGATPMSMRCDSLCAAAEIVLIVEQLGKQEAVHSSVATTGGLTNYPNTMNTIPSCVEMKIDMRSNNEDSLDLMQRELENAFRELSQKRHVKLSYEPLKQIPPVHMDGRIVEELTSLCEQKGLSHMKIISGAGHDASEIAGEVPSGMIFIPCKNGVSHNRNEYADTLDIATGVDVLLKYFQDK